MTNDARTDFDSPKNPVKAIRLKCRDCCNDQTGQIDGCTVKTCPLHPFRFGKNPYRTKRELSDDQKAAAGERFKTAREQKGC